MTCALSEALDFVGIDDTLHSKRVAYMATEVAKKMGWDIGGNKDFRKLLLTYWGGIRYISSSNTKQTL